MTRFAKLCLTLLLALSLPHAHAQAGSVGGIATVRLTALGDDAAAVDIVWEKSDMHDGVLDIGLDSGLLTLTTDDQPPALILAVEPALTTARVSVRQRSVSYLEVGDEGPHVSVQGSEQRSAWRTVTAYAPGRYRVQKLVGQKVKMGHTLLATVFADEPHWLQLALACKGPNEGACSTITDPEFEVTVTDADGSVTRKIVRVTFPNGC